jgi:hypothetical protein
VRLSPRRLGGYWPELGHSPFQNSPTRNAEFTGDGGLQVHIRIVPFSPVRYTPKAASACPLKLGPPFRPGFTTKWHQVHTID